MITMGKQNWSPSLFSETVILAQDLTILKCRIKENQKMDLKSTVALIS
jgi:hypothetical protein